MASLIAGLLMTIHQTSGGGLLFLFGITLSLRYDNLMYQFAYSTNAFTGYPLVTALKKIKEIGFTGVEIVFDQPHFRTQGVAIIPAPRLIKKLLPLNKLVVSNINANTARMLDHRLQITDYRKSAISNLKSTISKSEPTLISPEISFRRRRVEYSKRAIDLAHFLGALNISLTGGPLPPETSTRQALCFFQQSLEEILDYAAAKNIRVGIEYEPGHLIDNARKTFSLIKKINHPLLGINLDIGHSAVAGEKPDEIIKKFAGRIWNIHIEDIKNRKHFHLIPGKGHLDFFRIKKSLEEINYRGWLTVELYTYPHQPIRAGRAALKKLETIF